MISSWCKVGSARNSVFLSLIGKILPVFSRISVLGVFAVSLAGFALFGPPAYASSDEDAMLEKVGFSPILGGVVNLDLQLTRDDGATTSLRSYQLPNRPLIVIPVYYNCPRLCGLILSGFSTFLRETDLVLGKDFQVAVVSFDHKETAADAKKSRDLYLSRLGVGPEAQAGFRFFVAQNAVVSELMQQIGFRFEPDGVDFAHSAGIVLLTPKGEISQFFSGIEFPRFDVKLALVEASRGHIGSALDHIMLYCFRFDVTKGRYTWAAFGLLRIGGALTLILFGGLLFSLWRKERLRAGHAAPTAG